MCWSTSTRTLRLTKIGRRGCEDLQATARSRHWLHLHLSGNRSAAANWRLTVGVSTASCYFDPHGLRRVDSVKTYMVIERFKPGCLSAVYQRFEAKGRMLPPGLFYLNSWLEKEGHRCFQLMEADDPRLFGEWTK